MRRGNSLSLVICSSVAFLDFEHPFPVTACTHSSMSLKSWEGGGLQEGQGSASPPLPTPLVCMCAISIEGGKEEQRKE